MLATINGYIEIKMVAFQITRPFFLAYIHRIMVGLFFVPGGVHEVVFGDFYVDFFGLGGVHHFFEFGGTASPEFVGADLGAREHDGSGSHD